MEGAKLEREKGFEPSTPSLARRCSTTELLPRSHCHGSASYRLCQSARPVKAHGEERSPIHDISKNPAHCGQWRRLAPRPRAGRPVPYPVLGNNLPIIHDASRSVSTLVLRHSFTKPYPHHHFFRCGREFEAPDFPSITTQPAGLIGG